jgi:ABC-type antimicrobial peptide transport system ATPase subunit
MIISNSKKYNFSITKGSLLLEESKLLFENIDNRDIFNEEFKIDFKFLPQNSLSAQKTIGNQLIKRIRATKWPELWEDFKAEKEIDKKFILFFAVCNYYDLVQHFMIDVYHKKWLNMHTDLKREDVLYFINLKESYKPEINDLQEYTKEKISQVIFTILNQVGLIKNEQITTPQMGKKLKEKFLNKGEKWFIDITHQN